MNSDITDASQDKLINLIYHHLKDNGYKKAANVLRKHAPQVETEEAKASLSEIFKKWASSGDGDGVRTTKLKSPAKKKSSTKSKITAPSAVSPKKSVKKKTERSKKQKKKKGEKRSVPLLAAAGNDSDSDSDSVLDVEKWRKMVSELSDADRVKIDVLSILEKPTVSSPAKSSAKRRTTRKPAGAKKEGNPAKKAKSSRPAKKSTAIPDASETPSKKSKEKDSAAISEHHEVKTPSKKTGNKKICLDVVKTPKRTKAKATKSAQDETDIPEAHHETNGLIATPLTRTKEVGVSDSEAKRTPKRVRFKEGNSFLEPAETSSTETPSKKAKKNKKGRSEASNVETDNSPLIINNVQNAANKLLETNVTIDATSEQSETPSKKVKNKKHKSVVEPVSDETPSKKVKAKKTEGTSEIDQETTSDVALESVKPDSPIKKAKLKDGESHSETVESETPSKKVKAKKVKSTEESGEEETTSKKLKTAASDADLPQSGSTNSFSEKRKIKAAEDVEIPNDVPSETPLKSSKSQAKVVDGESLGNDETSSHDLKNPSKKRKLKREEACDVPAPEEATPEPKKAKKDKKKKSEENENTDALQPSAAEEEEEAAVSVPVEISQKKKKKKKKERDEETQEIAADDPPVSAPDEEVVVHKKKKKSSKEKQLSSDETHGLNGT